MNPQDNTLDYPQTPQQQDDASTPQQQVLDRLRSAVNVLVTVSNSPTVDQLSAAIGFTLLLNKMGKHATAVFSGDVPSTIEFLKPEDTLEKNTDSLRDFIVSLDKAKADKLRYKVEENVVKIFITPYKTSLSEKDLNFSQGDFNVDAIIALGITEREQLDQAIIAHGRILHDATVITVSAGSQGSSLGAINWQDPSAASLCEMLIGLGDMLQPGLLDNQIATAYLTGIVAQTGRFKNENTTPKIMTLAASLLAAGANQQLIANSLEQPQEVPVDTVEPQTEVEEQSPDGALSIDHSSKTEEPATETIPMADSVPMEDTENEVEQKTDPVTIDENGNLSTEEVIPSDSQDSRRMLPRPSVAPLTNQELFGGDPHTITAGMLEDGQNEPVVDPLSVENKDRILDHSMSTLPPLPEVEPEENSTMEAAVVSAERIDPLAPIAAPEPPSITEAIVPQPPVTAEPVQPDAPVKDVLTLPPAFDTDTLHDIEKTFVSPHITEDPSSTLDDIEKVVDSPHQAEASMPMADVVDSARDAVQDAVAATPYDTDRPEPVQALNANPLFEPSDTALPQIQQPTLLDPTADPVLASLGLSGSDPTVTQIAPKQLDEHILSSSPAITLDNSPNQSQLQPTIDENFQQVSTVIQPAAQTGDPSGQSPPPVPPPMISVH